MSYFKSFFKPSNIGTVIFFLLNMFCIVLVFSAGFTMWQGIPLVIVIYLIALAISLSPLGESITCFMIGAKQIKRKDVKIKLIPLLEIVYNRAIKESPDMVKTINLRIIYDSSPNAYVVGRHTICVTEGLLQLPDRMIMGILAHEVGHIVHHHSVFQVAIGGSNFFISAFLMMMRFIAYFIAGIFAIFALRSRSVFEGIVKMIVGSVGTVFVIIWIKICLLFLRSSMRANEYEADQYAAKIGFGYELASTLDSIKTSEPSNKILKTLFSTHPDTNDRIARLQAVGVEYYNY